MEEAMSLRPDLEGYMVEIAPKVRAFLSRQLGHFINNAMEAPSAPFVDVFDPATGKILTRVPDGQAEDIDRAVAAARAAFERGPWPAMRPSDREQILMRLSQLIGDNGEEIAQLETLNQGKSINLSRAAEVGHAVEFIRYMAGWATKIEGATIDVSIPVPPGARYRAMVVREPVGVVGAIVPWNFPLGMAVWKVAPALACGCTLVLKPAEETPLTALRLAELCAEAGVPPGVINVVTGRGETTGAALARHPSLDKIAFTGSTEVGKLIGRSAIENMTRFSLELGGKSPVIVLADTPVEIATSGAAGAIFFNQGQVCTAGSRLYIEKSKFDIVVDALATSAKQMSIGPGLDPDNMINPLVSARHQKRVQSYINRGIEEGATALAGGAPVDLPGYYVRPTVLVDVNQRMTVVREEIFGPVVTAMPFENEDEVIKFANDSSYGLSASVWSNDLKRVMTIIPKIKAGTVWVNCHNMIDPNMPFGGYKQSGYGREHGRAMLDLYTESKSICLAY
jgi:phenylacetaldehyde dehydrogenase